MYDPENDDEYNDEPSYHSYGYNLPQNKYDWDEIDPEEE